jgi:hypothetical protein
MYARSTDESLGERDSEYVDVRRRKIASRSIRHVVS